MTVVKLSWCWEMLSQKVHWTPKKKPHLGPRMVDDGNSKKLSPMNKAFFPNWTATTKQPISHSHWNRLNYTLSHASYQWKAFTLTICTTGSSPSGFKRPPRLPKCGFRGIVRTTLPMLMCLKIRYIEKFILRQHQLLTDLKIYPTH